MKFRETWASRLVLGIVFSLFMLLVSLLMMFIIFPLVLIPMGVGILTNSGSILTIVGGMFSLLMLAVSCIVIGWAVMYFYRKNVFIYKKR